MADERSNAPGAGLTLSVRLSARPALFGAVAALASGIGGQAGCAAADAARFGEAVGLALALVVDAAPPDATPVELDVAFEGGPRWLRADVSCAATEQGRTFPLDQALSADRLEALRSRVDRADIVQDRGRACCRLTRQIRPR